MQLAELSWMFSWNIFQFSILDISCHDVIWFCMALCSHFRCKGLVASNGSIDGIPIRPRKEVLRSPLPKTTSAPFCGRLNSRLTRPHRGNSRKPLSFVLSSFEGRVREGDVESEGRELERLLLQDLTGSIIASWRLRHNTCGTTIRNYKILSWLRES